MRKSKAKKIKKNSKDAALARESKRVCEEQILRKLAMSMDERMNFLRVRLPGGGSAL